MATGTTVTITTKPGTGPTGLGSDPVSVTVTDAGTPTAGTIQVLYDDAATQSELIKAIEDFRAYVLRAVNTII
jgi:hypothetical protein